MEEKDQTTAMQPASSQALAETFDDLVADSGRGRENIDANDIRPPRMKLCQSGSPERKIDNPKQIKGLQELDLFNSQSNEIYGRELDIVVVAFLGKSFVLFDKDTLEVVERDLKADDPRCQFTLAEDGKTSVRPDATTFYNFLLWLPEKQDMVLFSFKGKSISSAKQLINFMNAPLKIDGKIVTMEPPPWALTYHVQTKMVSEQAFSFGVVSVTRKDGLTPPELRKQLSAFAKKIEGKKIVVDVDEAPEVEQPAQPQGQGDPTDM